ncbi:class F sortase [Streptomyces sp. NPDC000410]|uniref:class F sortase n=1 Tax=Streptomyces sp. NPDC000410 TaxID=3154254 RepID=UPI00332DE7DD
MRMKAKGWLIAIAFCIGAWLIQNGSQHITPPTPSAAQALAAFSAGWHTEAAADPLPPSEPVRFRIPRLDVDAPVMGLGLAPDNSLVVPPAADPDLTGWYEDGTAPGAKGTAIVVGHVDNADGPAVLYHLGTLKKGHRIEVLRKDGRTAVFTVDAVEAYEIDDFPDQKVYGPADRAELRVITCGGRFDARTGYQGNVVAYAHLIGVRE